MNKFNVFINKKTISIQDRGFNFGDGVFETILVRENKPLWLRKHFQRMAYGCKSLQIDVPPLSLIKECSTEAISNTRNCILKIYITRGASKQGYQIDANSKPNIYLNKISTIPSLIKLTGLKLKVSRIRLADNTILSRIKHMNRIEQSLASHEMLHEKSLYDDLLLLDNNKNIIETISSNIFFVKQSDKTLSFHTPELSKCGIEGIRRSLIIDAFKKKKRKVFIEEIKISELKKYQFAFICNSIKGVRFIKSINTVKFREPTPILELFEGLI